MNLDSSQYTSEQPAISSWFERLLRWWVGLFALCMFLDGTLPWILDESFMELPWLVSRLCLAGFAISTHCALTLSPKFPRRVTLPLIFVAYWAVGGGFPLPLFDLPRRELLVGGMEIAVAMLALFLLCVPGATPSALKLAYRPWVSGWNTAGMLFLTLVFSPFLLVAWGINGAAWGVDEFSKGYIRIRPRGLVLEERRYTRGGDEVWLVGMMHIANADFYKGLFPERGDVPPTIVLLEGVSDRENKLRGGFSMQNFARVLGLSSQHEAAIHVDDEQSAFEEGGHLIENQVIVWKNGMRLKRADIDVSEFRPETLIYLGEVGKIFASTSLLEIFQKMFDTKSPLANEKYQKLAFEDILDKRNLHLMQEIEAAFPAYDRVIVPWGALHLPEIGEWLKERGFEEKEIVERVAVPFPTMRGGL